MITEMGDWAGPSYAAPTCERVVWRYVRHSSLHDTRDAVEDEGRELQKGFALAIEHFQSMVVEETPPTPTRQRPSAHSLRWVRKFPLPAQLDSPASEPWPSAAKSTRVGVAWPGRMRVAVYQSNRGWQGLSSSVAEEARIWKVYLDLLQRF